MLCCVAHFTVNKVCVVFSFSTSGIWGTDIACCHIKWSCGTFTGNAGRVEDEYCWGTCQAVCFGITCIAVGDEIRTWRTDLNVVLNVSILAWTFTTCHRSSIVSRITSQTLCIKSSTASLATKMTGNTKISSSLLNLSIGTSSVPTFVVNQWVHEICDRTRPWSEEEVRHLSANSQTLVPWLDWSTVFAEELDYLVGFPQIHFYLDQPEELIVMFIVFCQVIGRKCSRIDAGAHPIQNKRTQLIR